jgi:hypothetical protein
MSVRRRHTFECGTGGDSLPARSAEVDVCTRSLWLLLPVCCAMNFQRNRTADAAGSICVCVRHLRGCGCCVASAVSRNALESACVYSLVTICRAVANMHVSSQRVACGGAYYGDLIYQMPLHQIPRYIRR